MLDKNAVKDLVNDYMRSYTDMSIRWAAKQQALGHDESAVTTLILIAQTYIGQHGRETLQKIAQASLLPEDEQDAAFLDIEREAERNDVGGEFQARYDEALKRAKLGEF